MHTEKLTTAPETTPANEVSTLEAARLMGLAVRSVQLMVDRGELQAWKTPGGHRRISRQSMLQWLNSERPNQSQPSTAPPPQKVATHPPASLVPGAAPRVLLIEDSIHFQNLVTLVVQQHFPQVNLRVASDAITGLVMAGEFHPDVLIVDILLPGMDGATLISSLRSNAQFQNLQLIVITSLDSTQREAYAFALHDIPVIHKPALVMELPTRLRECMHALAAPVA
jgi:excisionase family DNA binding protein